MPHRPWPLAVKLIAGHGAGGGDPGRDAAVPSASLAASGSGPEARRELAGGRGCRPWIIRRPGPETSRRAWPAAVQLAGTWENLAARSARTLSRRHVE